MAANLTAALFVMIVCLVIQCAVAVGLLKTLHVIERRHLLRPSVPRLVAVLTIAMLILLMGLLLQVGVWAAVYLAWGEFPSFRVAFYHSMVNFTTLGYGDLVMSPEHRMLGALEAANGVLMFGLTTSVLISVVNAMVQRIHKERDS